jgi:hypothetical protein
MAACHSITVAQVRDLFSYDTQAGVLLWRKHSRPACVGQPVPVYCDRGYQKTRVNRVWCRVHRLIWMVWYGEDAPAMIDHVDGDRSNNRIENLRATDAFLNQQNRREAERGSKVALLGVSVTRTGKYRAKIRHHSREVYLGMFDTADAAHKAYLKAKKDLHGHSWLACQVTDDLRVATISPSEVRFSRQESTDVVGS